MTISMGLRYDLIADEKSIAHGKGKAHGRRE